MRRPFTVIAIILFFLIALFHAARLWLPWDVRVDGTIIPMLASVVLLAIALIMAIGLWIELASSRRQVQAPAPERQRPGTSPRPLPGGLESFPGARLPANYFLFASRGVTPSEIKDAARKHGRVLVGFDSGNVPESSLKAAKEVGAELEVYVEGPGGVTGSTGWLPDEIQRVRAAAVSVGIDVGKKDWMKDWNKWGWKDFTFNQLEQYLREGYAAAEIDNLYNGIGEEPEAVVTFFKEYGMQQAAGRLPRLIMKNLNEDQLEHVVRAVLAGELLRSMFSEFHISEKGSGDRRKQDALSSRIGIRTVPSNDTYNYDAKGVFGLDAQFAEMVELEKRVIAAADAARRQSETA
jgi:hypothetical protein